MTATRLSQKKTSMITQSAAQALARRYGSHRHSDVTDPDLDAPDGAVVGGRTRVGDQWLTIPLSIAERDAFLDWVRWRMIEYAEGASASGWTWSPDSDLREMSEWIALDLFDDEADERGMIICKAALYEWGFLTANERDQMAHAIGHHSAKGCSVHGGRNHYATASDDPVWCSLVARGLAKSRTSSLLPGTEVSFSLTSKGVRAVERDPRSKREGRKYVVRFRGYEDHGVYVYAESRGKAKYQAVMELLDAMNCTASEAFRQITSCRLA